MARKTIKVDVSTDDPTVFIKLTKDIAAKDKALGDKSPLRGLIDMTDFAKDTQEADDLDNEIDRLQAQLAEKLGKRAELLGTADGQNSQTPGTLLFRTLQVRDILLGANRGNEDALQPWGFGVQVGSAKNPKRAPKTK